MNDQGEEHQSLDIGLLRYSGEEFGIRDATKVPKDVLIEEANPAEIYLYDHPEEDHQHNNPETSQSIRESLNSTTGTYDGEKNTNSYINDTSNHINSNNGGSNEKTRDTDPQSTLTPLKQRDRHDYREEQYHQRDLGPDKEISITASHENSIPANQEMQSTDTLLTRASFDNRGSSEGNDSTEQPFYVNAKQYYRILKRRYTRAKLEENLRISRERRPYLHESRHKHAMRRPRGQGGRFLTLAEIEAMKSKEGSSGSSAPSPPNVTSESAHAGSGPRLIERQGPKPKKLKPADSSNR